MKRILSVLTALLILMLPLCAGAGTVTIPSGLTEIPESMFEDSTGLTDVVIPDNITKIGARAFANCGLATVTVSSKVTYIADDAFDGCTDLIAYVNTGSYAETYFKKHGIETKPKDILDMLSSYTCSSYTKATWTTMDKVFYRRVKNTTTQCVATLYDITTGYYFSIRRVGADNHADIETMTKADTATLCKMLGVSKVSEISSTKHYQRRPCLLILNKHIYPCSLYAVPHDGGRPSDETLLSNGLSGKVMCLHFYGSKTSDTNKTDSAHQAAVKSAYSWWVKNYGN